MSGAGEDALAESIGALNTMTLARSADASLMMEMHALRRDPVRAQNFEHWRMALEICGGRASANTVLNGGSSGGREADESGVDITVAGPGSETVAYNWAVVQKEITSLR